MRTLKKVFVDPDCKHPYLILDCLAKSSTELIGASILSIVRKAARLAVYDDIMISVKNHQKLATVRAEMALQKMYWRESGQGNNIHEFQCSRKSMHSCQVFQDEITQKNLRFYLGKKSHPCCTQEAIENHKQWWMEAKGVSPSSESNSKVS